MPESPGSNWYVLTGRPCSGISTTLAALSRRGYPVVEEAARAVIDEKRETGLSAVEARADDHAFQREILERKLVAENRIARRTLHILDRGLPDSAAYYELAGMDPLEVLGLCEPKVYKGVFFMEPLPYVQDYARTESLEALDWLGKKLRTVYLDLGYSVISVPAGPVDDRVDWIQSRL